MTLYVIISGLYSLWIQKHYCYTVNNCWRQSNPIMFHFSFVTLNWELLEQLAKWKSSPIVNTLKWKHTNKKHLQCVLLLQDGRACLADLYYHMRAVWKVRGLVAVHCCYVSLWITAAHCCQSMNFSNGACNCLVSASYPIGTRSSFPRGKVAMVWHWPLTSI
jgi:hypothetical protein